MLNRQRAFAASLIAVLFGLFLAGCTDSSQTSPEPAQTQISPALSTVASVLPLTTAAASTTTTAFPSATVAPATMVQTSAAPALPVSTSLATTNAQTSAKSSPSTPASAKWPTLQSIYTGPATLATDREENLSLALSPTAKLLATAGRSSTTHKPDVILWDTSTGKSITELTGHTDSINNLTFSGDGTLLATGSQDATAKLWDVAKAKLIRTFAGDKAPIHQVVFSPNNKILATIDEKNTLTIWDVDTGRLLSSASGGSHSYDSYFLLFSPDSKTLVEVDDKAPAIVTSWQVEAGQLKKIASFVSSETNRAKSVSFADSGQTLVILDDEGMLHYLSLKTQRQTATQKLPGGGYVGTSVLSNNVQKVAAIREGDDYGIEISNLDPSATPFKLTGTHVDRSTNVYRGVDTLIFSHDGQKLAALSTDGVVEMWDLVGKKLLKNFLIYPDVARSSRFIDNGQTLATVHYTDLKFWDAKSGKLLTSIPTAPFATIVFSKDNKYFAEQSGPTITLRETATGKVSRLVELQLPVNAQIKAIAFPGIDQTLSVYTFDAIKSWDLSQPQNVPTFTKADFSRYSSLTLSPDQQILLGTWNSAPQQAAAATFWNPQTGDKIADLHTEIDHSEWVSFGSDGQKLVVVFSSGGVTQLELLQRDQNNFAQATTFKLADNAYVNSVAYTDTVNILVASVERNALYLWDTRTNELLENFSPKTSSKISQVAVSDKGLIWAAFEDGSFNLWELKEH